jgi:hypothetical protein
MANTIYGVLSKLEGLPGFLPATPEQLRASLPRREWNAEFPELFVTEVY